MDRLVRFLLYGGETKETFTTIQSDLVKSNRTSILVFSLIAAAGMTAMATASFFVDMLAAYRVGYLVCLVTCLALALIAWQAKKPTGATEFVIYTCVYVFVGMLYAFGIALGTFIDPNAPSVNFPVLLVAAPLLFVDAPLHMAIATVLGVLAYTGAAFATQTAQMIQFNLSSIIPYGFVSIAASSYMMRIKIHRFALEHQNKHLIETDQLTGLLNRRSFDQHMQILQNRDSLKGVQIYALDVNGLKSANDSIGHHGGDELIIGAADAIQNVFGSYGRCYRVGGDEFMAVVEGASPQPDELRDALDLRCSHFHGTFVSGLSVSMGSAVATGTESIGMLIRQADTAMYREKTRYYLTNGIDRRRRA